MRRIKDIIVNAWLDFWYEWHHPAVINYGGTNRSIRVFRKQRFFNVIVIAVLMVLAYVVLTKL